MRIVFVGDIHGNLPALQAVRDHANKRNPDMVVCMGDIVGVLGEVQKCVEIIYEWADVSIIGNHDTRICDQRNWLPTDSWDVLEYEQAMEQLTDDQRGWLCGLPVFMTLDGGNILVTHIRPDQNSPVGNGDDSGIRKKNIPAAGSEYVSSADYQVLATGHTHQAYVERLDGFDGQSGLMINGGAVAFPYDATTKRDGTHIGKATYAVYDTHSDEAWIEAVEYDSTQLVEYIRKCEQKME